MRVADQVVAYVRRLHPAQRRAIKTALRSLAAGRETDSKPLENELEGFFRLRVGRFRLVYRHLKSHEISCEFIERRKMVYTQFASIKELLADE
jgi:mRNA interferase RelE/StbE